MAQLGVIWADGVWNLAAWNTAIWEQAGGPDTTPDAFTFTDQTDVARSTVITSAPITVAAIDAAANISVTGGEYSINGGAFTSSSGIGAVVNGDQIRARHTSSASYSTAANTAVTIGGVSDTFTSTTLAEPAPILLDQIPNLSAAFNCGSHQFDLSAYFEGADTYAIDPALETGWSFDANTGILTIDTDVEDTFGPYTVTATNGQGDTESNAFTVKVSVSTGSVYGNFYPLNFRIGF